MPFGDPILGEHPRKKNVQAIIWADPNLKMIAALVLRSTLFTSFRKAIVCVTNYDNSRNYHFYCDYLFLVNCLL